MRFPTRLLTVLLATFAVLTIQPVGAYASEPSTPGALSAARPDGTVVELPLRHTSVSIEVTAFVARTTIEQVFANPFTDPVEAVYTFPLGDRAAVDDFELHVGERTIRGEIKRREEARATYEAARASGQQAALLEQERPNVFTQSVANLEPGKSVTVRLRTIETLPYERGVYRLTFPLVVGPRYIPGGATAQSARLLSPTLPPGTRSGHDVAIAVTIAAGVPIRNIESPSHKTIVNQTSANGAAVRLADGDAIPNKDFLLRWSVASEKPSVGLLAHRDGPDGYFTLLVQPKGDIAPTEAAPKEITFVVDTSGSMSGVPLEASKRFAAKALHALGPRDTFNVIRFSGDNEVYAKDPLPNDSDAVEAAIAWLERRQGAGGTEMLPALDAAFARPADPNRVRVVIVLTDGFVGNEEEILADIGRVVGDARIYTVGIGSSVNHHLLDRMAEVGRGAYVFVRPDQDPADALEAFRSWVTLPYLTDLSIDWGALPVADLSPARLRDLGAGQTLTLVGRYLKAAEGNVVVRGKLGGSYWEQTTHVVLPEHQTGHGAISSVWARGRIEDLMRDAPRPIPDAVRDHVIALALTHRLMSPYTSFVAVDDTHVVNPSGTPRTVRQALPLPEGSFGGGAFDRADIVVVTAEKTSVGGAFMSANLPPAPPPPVAGRFYQNVLALSPGVQAPDGDGNPNVSAARERDFKTMLKADDATRVRDAAFRVLAELAENGTLSAAEGKPALAELRAAQRPTGEFKGDVAVDAIATWAIAEAAAISPGDASLTQARTKAVDSLAARASAPADAEGTRWARLVLSWIRPEATRSIPEPKGQPSAQFSQLRASLAAAKNGGSSPNFAGTSPFDRLVRAIGRGHLKVAR